MTPEQKAALERAYRGTTFHVQVSEGRTIGIRVGNCHPHLDRHLEQHLDGGVQAAGGNHWAYVTAFNPGSRRFPPEENARRHADLVKHVRERGYPMWPGQGAPDEDGWPPEESVLIAGISRDDAIALGEDFGQNAIVAGECGGSAELVWCVDCGCCG